MEKKASPQWHPGSSPDKPTIIFMSQLNDVLNATLSMETLFKASFSNTDFYMLI